MKTTLSIALGMLFVLGSFPAHTQEETSAYVAYSGNVVDHDKIELYEDLLRERRDAWKAAGHSYVHVFERVRHGESAYLSMYEDPDVNQLSLADADISPTWAAQIGGIAKYHILLTVEMPSAFVGNTDRGLGQDGDLLDMRVLRTAPGRAQAYYDWQADQLFPALRKAGVRMYGARAFLGDSNRTFLTFSVLEDWAEFTNPDPAHNSAELQKIRSAGEEMIVSTEQLMYRYRGDLSFSNER